MTLSRISALCVGALLLGFAVRGMSVAWNAVVAHGDVHMDASASASLLRYGQLLTFEEGQEDAQAGSGRTLAQHGPLWPVLGAGTTMLRGGERDFDGAYFSLRLLSFFSGLAVLGLLFLLARRLLDEVDAWIVTGWAALSYLLIDYSGNGSLYMFQAALYLLWILIAAGRMRWRWAALGIISGVSYLLNFQSIVLLPATAIVLWFSGSGFSRRKAMHVVGALLIACLIVTPWLLRNAIIFGDPLYSHAVNQSYLFIKAGMGDIVRGDAAYPSLENWLSIIPTIVTVWLPNNLYYILRKLLILAPVASVVAVYGGIDLLFSPQRFKKMFPIVVILVAHVLMSAAWPVMKFRYFVPLLPFVFLLAVEQMRSLPVRWRQFLIGATTVGLVVIGILQYRSVVTHTVYYDGAITQDAYHGFEERTYLRDRGILPMP